MMDVEPEDAGSNVGSDSLKCRPASVKKWNQDWLRDEQYLIASD